MTDTGWEKWADNATVPESLGADMADACVEYLRKRPDAPAKWQAYANKLALAVRGEDGTIMAFQADVRAERVIYADS